jgi:hypothetical protein
MNRRRLQCTSRFGRNHRLREEHLSNSLNRSKSGGDQIRGGEGMESPRNHQPKVGGTPNRLEIILSTGMRNWGRKESKCTINGRSKEFIPRGTRLVR